MRRFVGLCIGLIVMFSPKFRTHTHTYEHTTTQWRTKQSHRVMQKTNTHCYVQNDHTVTHKTITQSCTFLLCMTVWLFDCVIVCHCVSTQWHTKQRHKGTHKTITQLRTKQSQLHTKTSYTVTHKISVALRRISRQAPACFEESRT